jgi:hypothetical protein
VNSERPYDENLRIRPQEPLPLEGRSEFTVECEPYGVHFCYFMGHRWNI